MILYDVNILEYAQILAEYVKRAARAAGLPEKFILGVKAKKVGVGRAIIYNDWRGPNGEPLATYFNDGTKRNYVIEPKVVHPEGGKAEFMGHSSDRIDPPNKAVQHPSVLHWEEGGKDFFAKRVIHPGQPATHVFQIGIREGRKALIQKVKKDSHEHLLRYRRGGGQSTARIRGRRESAGARASRVAQKEPGRSTAAYGRVASNRRSPI